jgi:transmembrane sensor
MERMIQDELRELLEKARAGNATGDDFSRIAAIISADQTGELIAQTDQFLAQDAPVSSQHIEPYNYEYWQRAFLEMKESWQQQNIQPVKVRHMPSRRRWFWAAASIIVLLSAGAYLLSKKNTVKPVAGVTKILPGKEGAILTLADGSQVLLDTIKNGVVALQGGTTAKIVNGTLIYEGVGSQAVYNIMSTPKARKFHVILPDGTHAWLNSASSIQYPTAFTGNERKVSVTGEVYFEVAKNKKMPFRLNVNNKAEIEVLGTHFNVKAYENEEVINTTLLEGSIAIALSPEQNEKMQQTKERSKNRSKLILKPGQQAQILVGQNTMQVNGVSLKEAAAKKAAENKSGVTVINNTDIDRVMAWKNGVFDFNDIAFADAMYQIERWYDIQVIYEKGIPADIELNGKITKDNTLNDLVVILEKIGVKCRLEGRKLLIQS